MLNKKTYRIEVKIWKNKNEWESLRLHVPAYLKEAQANLIAWCQENIGHREWRVVETSETVVYIHEI